MNLHIDRNKPGRRRLSLHYHKYPEIIFFLEGNGVFHTQTGDHPFFPGLAVMVPPGFYHSSESSQDFFSIGINGDFSPLIMSEDLLFFRDNEQGDGAYLVRLLYRSRHSSTQPFMHDLTSAYIRFLLQQGVLRGPQDAAVNQICQELSERALEQDLDVTALLDASGYAQDYIRALFRKRYGMSPLKFLTRIRMEHARFLLDTYKGAVSLSEVAQSCGYDDYIYFSKSFKASTGLSPRDYLKARQL